MPNSGHPFPKHWLNAAPERLGPNTLSDGVRVVTHLPSARKRRQALRFYRELAPRLWEVGARTPKLLEVEGDYLLCTWHPGRSDPGVAAHQAAGLWLRALHSLDGVPSDPLPLDQAFAKRIEALLPQLPPPWTVPLSTLDLSPLKDVPRLWCHRDLHPRNWLWDGEGLVVLDFEHAAPDLGALDWVRVPERQALLVGYGGLKEQEEKLLFIAGVVNAAATLVWGLRHEDEHWVFTGQQRLRAWIPIG